MQKINYITNLNVNNFSGGWSGMNHHVYLQLKKKFEVNLVQNINPSIFLLQKVSSKLFRSVGLKGSFPAFSDRRLNIIKTIAEKNIDKDASLNFFHGSTSWLHTESSLPYALYLDCCFSTYIRIYHKSQKFSENQLSSLFKKETDFIKKAKAVFFSSRWAMVDTKKSYGIQGDNFFVAGLGGGFESKCTKTLAASPYFLFVGLDFEGKGGDKVVKAFIEVSKKHPEFKLKIAGQKPPAEYLQHKQIRYIGLIDKSQDVEFKKLVDLFCNAYCFVLPTSKDITPLVLVEAGSVGCPVIATSNFGIPEIVKDGETGFLINNNNLLEEQLAQKMLLLCGNIELRNKTGATAKQYIDTNFNWDKTGNIICEKISFLKIDDK